MRHLLLLAAKNRWLKERLPRMRFVRRAVRRFMPGETLADALGAAIPLQAAGIRTLYTHLGENLENLAAADRGRRSLRRRHRPDRGRRDRRRGLGQAHPARPGPRRRRLPRPPRADRRARRGGRLVPLGRHGGQRLLRGHDLAVRTAARRPAEDRHLPAGLPAPDRGRHRTPATARPGDPPGQGRLRGARLDRLHEPPEHRRQLPRAGGPVPARWSRAADPARPRDARREP